MPSKTHDIKLNKKGIRTVTAECSCGWASTPNTSSGASGAARVHLAIEAQKVKSTISSLLASGGWVGARSAPAIDYEALKDELTKEISDATDRSNQADKMLTDEDVALTPAEVEYWVATRADANARIDMANRVLTYLT